MSNDFEEDYLDDLEEDFFEDEEQDEQEDSSDGTPASSGEQGGDSSDEIPFVHLHVHSHYSLLDGAAKIDALVHRVKELGMKALALTDHGTLYGDLEFYQKCVAAGIKPIPGYEAYIAPGSRFLKQESARGKGSYYHLTLLAMNATGFKNLMKLATLAYCEGFYRKPRIDRELLEKYNEGLLCLSGCAAGEVPRLISDGQGSPAALEQAKEAAQWYKAVFGDRYYIELQDHGLEIQREVLAPLVKLAQELDIPTVATNDVHYVHQDDAEAQDILLCINTGKYRTDASRMRMDSDQFFLRSGKEMLAALPQHEAAIRRSVEIADRCDCQLDLGKRFFPNFVPPDGKSSSEYLHELCLAGLKRRYANNPTRMVNGELSQEVIDRLNRELYVINKLGFPNYFLIVWDIVQVAETRGIQRTARGSGVGALVCYALNMSHVCPLEYGLLFERFLDESRVEAPDIDIDFDQQRRGEIFDYVKEKYGENQVAQIGTFGTLAAKMAIRDVGRALSMSIPDVNAVTKLVPLEPKMTIKKALEKNPELQKMYSEKKDIRELIDLARKVEGLARSAGTHACAVVISDQPLTEFVPLQQVSGKTEFVTQWQAADVEKAGLLKMDFLGLRNLSILSDAISIIEQTTGQKIDPYAFSHDDPATYALLCRGETKGVFQLEGGGIRELLTRMKPDNFNDIIATLALYRPGPLDGGMVTDYIEVKHGRKEAQYLHPLMKEVLHETHGVMVYQEQVMQIIYQLGRVPLPKAYSCIKAISKKKEDQIQEYKEQFIEGALANGLAKEEAESIFKQIVNFAGYGFNKSHSTAYAQIAYMTAYLKANYPAEFMAALLSGDVSKRNFTKKDSTVEHLEDCEQMKIEIIPPSVNRSNILYSVAEGKITFGLFAIKGCGKDAAAEIVRAREAGTSFANIFDFYQRIDSRVVTRATVESLVKSGAFDCWGVKRSQLFQVLDRAIKMSQSAASDRSRGQGNLFAFFNEGEENEAPVEVQSTITEGLPEIEEWPDKEIATYEKEVLGFYLTSHPLKEHGEAFSMFSTCSIDQAARLPDRSLVTLGGMISSIKMGASKQKKEGQPSTYAMFDLEDSTHSIRTIIWPQQYALYSDLVKDDSTVFAMGRIDRSRSQNETDSNFIVDRLITVEQAHKEFTCGMTVLLDKERHPDEVKTLYEILKTYRVNGEGIGVEIHVCLPQGGIGVLRCPSFRVSLCDDLRNRVTAQFGHDAFRLVAVPKKMERAPERKSWQKKKG